MEFKKKEEEMAKQKQKKLEQDAELVKDMCIKLTKHLLPVPFDVKQNTSKNSDMINPSMKVKLELDAHSPDLLKNRSRKSSNCRMSTNGNLSKSADSDIYSKENVSIDKITELSTLVKSFIMQVSDMIMDDDVVFAVCKLKQIGASMKILSRRIQRLLRTLALLSSSFQNNVPVKECFLLAIWIFLLLIT